MNKKFDVLGLFHHTHHKKGKHIVHHCGGKHIKINSRLNYTIKHCGCNKHCIDRKEAVGHDLEFREVLVEFTEPCPEDGWHVESGVIKND